VDEAAFESFRSRHRKTVQGRIRARLGPTPDADDLEQEVWLRVWAHPPDPTAGDPSIRAWLRRVADNVVSDSWRRLGAPPVTRGELEWLFENTKARGLPSSVAIVAGLHLLLGVPLEQIAEDFSEMPLRELGSMLAEKCEHVTLEGLLEDLATERGEERLEDHWVAGSKAESRAESLKRWLVSAGLRIDGIRWSPTPARSQRDAVPLPGDLPAPAAGGPRIPPEVAEEGARMVLSLTQEPAETILHILNKPLELKPDEIRKEFEDKPLEAVLEWAVQELELRFPSVDWADCGKPLRQALEDRGIGQQRLPLEGKPTIEHRVDNVHRRFMSRVHDQEEDFLRTVLCQTPHKALTFFFMEILKHQAEELRPRSNDPLGDLAEESRLRYVEKTELAEGRVNGCFAVLAGNLERPPWKLLPSAERRDACEKRRASTIGRTVLNDYYAGNPREQDLCQWHGEIRKKVTRHLQGQGRGLVYAYCCGYLFGPDTKRAKRVGRQRGSAI